MTDTEKLETRTVHQAPPQADNTLVLRIPKPNMQVVVLGLVAFITLFQTFQLVRISGASSSATVKTAPAAATGSNSGSGAGSGAGVPQSMVGGC